MRRSIAVCLGVVAVLLSSIPCAAEEAIADAREHLRIGTLRAEEADFERALVAFDRAVEGEGLSRDDLIQLLVMRAMVQHALGNERAIDQELLRLASLEPHYSFDASVPPALQRRFNRLGASARRALELHVDAREIRGGFRIEAEVENDRSGLVRQLLIYTRVPGSDWVQTDGNRASIPAGVEGAIEYYVQGFGPGGALLVTSGSEDEPQLVGDPRYEIDPDAEPALRPDISPLSAPIEGEDTEERRISPWVWIGTGIGVLVVAAAVVTAVLLTGSEQETQLDSPEVDWP